MTCLWLCDVLVCLCDVFVCLCDVLVCLCDVFVCLCDVFVCLCDVLVKNTTYLYIYHNRTSYNLWDRGIGYFYDNFQLLHISSHTSVNTNQDNFVSVQK